MKDFKISSASFSIKLFLTILLCIVGLTYATLIVQKWVDTGEWPFMVSEGYQYMEYIELTDYVHIYLPYYWLFLFAIPITMFMLTSFSETLKRFFAVFPFIIIILDSISVYLIPYVWNGFAMLLWLTGATLGVTFLMLFILTLKDMWFSKVSVV